VAQWARPLNRPQCLLAGRADDSCQPRFISRSGREFFQLHLTSGHDMGSECGYSLADAAVTPRLRNDLKCVPWDVSPCSLIQSNLQWIPDRERIISALEYLSACSHLAGSLKHIFRKEIGRVSYLIYVSMRQYVLTTSGDIVVCFHTSVCLGC